MPTRSALTRTKSRLTIERRIDLDHPDPNDTLAPLVALATEAGAIALGFFEPAVARFPGEALREELPEALAAKLTRGAIV